MCTIIAVTRQSRDLPEVFFCFCNGSTRGFSHAFWCLEIVIFPQIFHRVLFLGITAGIACPNIPELISTFFTFFIPPADLQPSGIFPVITTFTTVTVVKLVMERKLSPQERLDIRISLIRRGEVTIPLRPRTATARYKVPSKARSHALCVCVGAWVGGLIHGGGCGVCARAGQDRSGANTVERRAQQTAGCEPAESGGSSGVARVLQTVGVGRAVGVCVLVCEL